MGNWSSADSLLGYVLQYNIKLDRFDPRLCSGLFLWTAGARLAHKCGSTHPCRSGPGEYLVALPPLKTCTTLGNVYNRWKLYIVTRCQLGWYFWGEV